MIEWKKDPCHSINAGCVFRGWTRSKIPADSHHPLRTIFHDGSVNRSTGAPQAMCVTVHLDVRGAVANGDVDMLVVTLVRKLGKRRNKKSLPPRKMCGDTASRRAIPGVNESILGLARSARLGHKRADSDPSDWIDFDIGTETRCGAGPPVEDTRFQGRDAVDNGECDLLRKT